MKKVFLCLTIFSIIAVIYINTSYPFVFNKIVIGENIFGNFNNREDSLEEDEKLSNNDTEKDDSPIVDTNNNNTSSNNSTTTPPSMEGNNKPSGSGVENGSNSSSNTPSTNKINYVYYTQDKSVTGLTGACLLTSFAMLITNAGRYYDTPKEYGPVDVYLANNPDAKSENDRTIVSWYYRIASGFNHKWINVQGAKDMTSSQKEAKVKELLKTHPWGVIIGGVYGTDGTHYVAVRMDDNGNLLFDDPVKSKGPNLTSISKVYGINDWSKIRQIMTIEPNLDSNGKWKNGVYDNCKNNPSSCHVCATNVDC